MSPRPKTRTGKVLDVAALLAAVAVMLTLSVSAAWADAPAGQRVAQAGPMEHAEETGGRRGHDDGTGYAHMNRPTSPTAESLMRELICMCGGCKRENLYACKCGYAAEERGKVLAMLGEFDLTSDGGRKKAYDSVVAAFVKEYGGEHVLGTPRSQLPWLLPILAVIGGLGVVFAVGMSWVKRGRAQLSQQVPAAPAEDDELAERLDDDLRNTD
jgi:cytochrome c-type biogenesis protein CcmH/NrfF